MASWLASVNPMFEEIFWKVLQIILFLQKITKKLNYSPQSYMPDRSSNWY